MASQDFYNNGNTGQTYAQPGYPNYQQPQYGSNSQQSSFYGNTNQQQQAQYGSAMQQNQLQPYPDNASQTQQPSYPAQQPMYQGEQGQPYLPSPQIRPSYDQYAPVVDEPQAGGGERGLGTHIVGAAGGRKVAKKMDLGPVAVLAAGFVGAKMLGNAKDKRDDKKRASSRDNRQDERYDDRHDNHHHHHHNHRN